MNNQYFYNIRKRAREWDRITGRQWGQEGTPFSKAESLAYKYWAIYVRYNANYIFLNESLDLQTMKELIEEFRKAKVETIVIATDIFENYSFDQMNCSIEERCKVFQRETQLYQGPLEIYYGIRIRIHKND